MNSDKEDSSIQVIGLATTVMQGPFMSDELMRTIEKTLSQSQKVVCIYNRR